MTTAELIAIAVSVIGFLSSLIVGLVAFNARGIVGDVRELVHRVNELEKKVAVLERMDLPERVKAVETWLGEMRSDIRSIREMLENDRGGRHRNQGD